MHNAFIGGSGAFAGRKPYGADFLIAIGPSYMCFARFAKSNPVKAP